METFVLVIFGILIGAGAVIITRDAYDKKWHTNQVTTIRQEMRHYIEECLKKTQEVNDLRAKNCNLINDFDQVRRELAALKLKKSKKKK